MATNIPQFTGGGRTMNGNLIKLVKIKKRSEEATRSNINCLYKVR